MVHFVNCFTMFTSQVVIFLSRDGIDVQLQAASLRFSLNSSITWLAMHRYMMSNSLQILAKCHEYMILVSKGMVLIWP